MNFPSAQYEIDALASGADYVIGCDEVGRGPIAGPVVACACILNTNFWLDLESEGSEWKKFVRDSKTVSEKKREEIEPKIKENAIAYAIGNVSAEEVDRINIHQATLFAMKQAVGELVKKLQQKESKKLKIVLLVDGSFEIKDLQIDNCEIIQKTVVHGDSKVFSVAAASIIAKVHRDNILKELDVKFPEYGFAKHKGYGTKAHFEAIIKHGQTAEHRKTFIKESAK